MRSSTFWMFVVAFAVIAGMLAIASADDENGLRERYNPKLMRSQTETVFDVEGTLVYCLWQSQAMSCVKLNEPTRCPTKE